MAYVVVHGMESPWNSSDTDVLAVTIDSKASVSGTASNRLEARMGALDAHADFEPAHPVDLRAFEELRFWIMATHPAEGTKEAPFYLEFSYSDADDLPGEEHRWFIPVNRAGVWEQRRIGVLNDRRWKITGFRIRCLTNNPFVCYVNELIAVREELLADTETALTEFISRGLNLPGMGKTLLMQDAPAGSTQVVLPLGAEFHEGNHVVIEGGAAGPEHHLVKTVTRDTSHGTLTLSLDPSRPIASSLSAGIATVRILVPVIVDPAPRAFVQDASPAILLTLMEAREDPARTATYTQRDSFRPRAAHTAVSLRPAAQAYVVDYQIVVDAPTREQQLLIQTHLLKRLRNLSETSPADALRINGQFAPLLLLPALVSSQERRLGVLAPIYVRICTHMEIALREEAPGIQQATLSTGLLPVPLSGGGLPGEDATETETSS